MKFKVHTSSLPNIFKDNFTIDIFFARLVTVGYSK